MARSDARSLYHRWRSQSFSEVMAQEHVTRTLRNAVASGRIVHAYLFCGPRGTGKTSTARILAKAVNCLDPQAGEPCNRCASCMAVNSGRAIDLIEIDAASNRGIDDARDLREKIKFSPAEARFKVYIIDEAHMLTSEASNALLKTLEEPPEHAILILATTEAHKILPTIASRCQRFDFRRIPLQAVIRQLEMICTKEALEVEAGVLDRVARMARGSLRDAESLLDQLVAYCGEKIELPSAREVLGLANEETVAGLAEAVRVGDLAAGFQLIDAAASTGADLRHFAREVLDYLRALMMAKSGASTSLTREFRPEELARLRAVAADWRHEQLLEAIRTFGDLEGRMRLEPFNELHLEIAFAEVALAGYEKPQAAILPPLEPAGGKAGAAREPGAVVDSAPDVHDRSRVAEPSTTLIGASLQGAGTGIVARQASGIEPSVVPAVGAEEGSGPPRTPPVLDLENVAEEWPRLRKELTSRYPGTAMVLLGCEPLSVDGNAITFGFKTDWRDKVERLDVGGKVAKSLSALFGTRVEARFRYGVSAERRTPRTGRDPVVETAVRELGFEVKRVEPASR